MSSEINERKCAIFKNEKGEVSCFIEKIDKTIYENSLPLTSPEVYDWMKETQLSFGFVKFFDGTKPMIIEDVLEKNPELTDIFIHIKDICSITLMKKGEDEKIIDMIKNKEIENVLLAAFADVNMYFTPNLKDQETEEQIKSRFVGCLVGLAVGDAYGTTFEFTNRLRMPAESQMPDEIIGGGPFDMKPGEWTDDTSMALCLAESIVEKGWDTDDQMKKYIKWWQEGYNSVKGECFDIGGATRNALSSYNMVGKFVVDPQAAGNGVLMRLAPIPMWTHDKEDAIFTLSLCAFQSSMTHPSSQSIECSMLMGGMINKILSGEKDKMKILNFDTLFDENSKQMYKELFEEYKCVPNPRIEQIKQVLYKDSPESLISGDGYCVYTLEAALWAFVNTDNFKDGLKKVVALGDDTDTTGAVYGQIAGAYYGVENIPWVEKIVWIDKIKKLAEDLYIINKNQ